MIRDRGVASRYAQALFGAARAENAEEEVLADLESLDQLYVRDPSLQSFLEAPDVLTEQKVETIDRILKGRVSDLAVRFLLLLLQKKRVQHLPLVFERFRELVETHQNVVRARVITAFPLPGDLAGALTERLAALTGKKIRLDPRVEPSVLGGVIVTLDGKIIDGSLRHELEEIRDRLLSTRVH